MFQELKLVFQTHAHVERYWTFHKYFAYKMEENSSTSEHVLKMSGYYNRLNQVEVNLLDKIVTDKSSLVTITKLLELHDELYMQGMTKTIPEIFVMLKSVKVEIKKSIKC